MACGLVRKGGRVAGVGLTNTIKVATVQPNKSWNKSGRDAAVTSAHLPDLGQCESCSRWRSYGTLNAASASSMAASPEMQKGFVHREKDLGGLIKNLEHPVFVRPMQRHHMKDTFITSPMLWFCAPRYGRWDRCRTHPGEWAALPLRQVTHAGI